MTEGNSKNLGANASLDAARIEASDEWRMGASAVYVETKDSGSGDMERSAQNAKAYLNYKRKFSQAFAYSDNSVFHDKLADLDYRAIFGLGVGRYLLDADAHKLSVELGAAYVHEELSPAERSDAIAMRVAERWEKNLGDQSRIWEWIEYLPKTEDFGSYLVNGELGGEAALDARLSLRVVVKDTYNSDSPAGKKENDLAVVASLLYRLL
ncbi:MAG: DUF481 domain-containing protein [Kiritimatiellia bacterium]